MKIPSEWTFHSEEIAANFDDHVRSQLPWYDLASIAVAEIARSFIPSGGLVYDIGCSAGNIGTRLAQTLRHKEAELIGIDNSQSMAAIYNAPGKIEVCSAESYDYKNFDVAIAFLTLMFIPVRDRPELINRLESRLRPGGAIIVVDKTLPPGGWMSTVFSRLTFKGKLVAGSDPASVIEKEMSLGGNQRPIDPRILGRGATEFFRFGDFAGYVITKGELQCLKPS